MRHTTAGGFFPKYPLAGCGQYLLFFIRLVCGNFIRGIIGIAVTGNIDEYQKRQNLSNE